MLSLLGDGRIVCSHNHDLERETDGFGYVHEMGYDDLRRIDAGIKYLKFSTHTHSSP